ncbi:hypothetical protein PUN28_008630 [Cardiocondyla obscurior]|uniref:Uncharacterized protein n=1 Tax=Cardiocondyla obscurior TaxID=286306 RepID=A0AAW2G023_9HYME
MRARKTWFTIRHQDRVARSIDNIPTTAIARVSRARVIIRGNTRRIPESRPLFILVRDQRNPRCTRKRKSRTVNPQEFSHSQKKKKKKERKKRKFMENDRKHRLVIKVTREGIPVVIDAVIMTLGARHRA